MAKFERIEEGCGMMASASFYNKAVDRVEELEETFSHFLNKTELFLSTKGINTEDWASYRDARRVINK